MKDINLLDVRKPARYIDSEWNVRKKEIKAFDTKIALCFPDVYEIGMSNLGLRILYGVLDKKQGVIVDRVFSPWLDMQELLRKNKSTLTSLELNLPLVDFDVLGFSLGYELNYTNILDILELSGIPLFSCQRDMHFPLIIGGGSCVINPEPMHEFFDLFLIGEAEEAILEIIDIVKKYKDLKKDASGKIKPQKEKMFLELAKIQGVYIPSLYDVKYTQDGLIDSIHSDCDYARKIIDKRFVKDLDKSFYPTSWIVPNTSIVHDHVSLEITRGCPNNCRFCQAASIYGPYRLRKSDTVINLARQIYKNTGYEEISLSGLSVCQHPDIISIITQLLNIFKENGVGLSLSSIKSDSRIQKILELITQIKKTTFTFAPEVGTNKLHKIINKGFDMGSLLDTAKSAVLYGYKHIKLYFMIGLPNEEPEDIDAILDVIEALLNLESDRPFNINVSISNFIPKPHTPLQWVGMQKLESLSEKKHYLKKSFNNRFPRFKKSRVKFSFHEPSVSYLEAVLTKADRRISKVIFNAWKKGARFDAWREHFKFNVWLSAFKENGINPEFYAYRDIGLEETLAWDHISLGPSKEYMKSEYEKALRL